jgi:hypothetical protein
MDFKEILMITNKIARAKCASNSTSTVMVSSYLGSPRTFRGWIKVDSYRFRVYTQEYIITPTTLYKYNQQDSVYSIQLGIQ